MKVLVLAAGYGTRMQGLIGDTPKALVSLGGRTILDHLLANLAGHCGQEDIMLVSNARYFPQFEAWQARTGVAIQLLNDGSTRVEDRLGAVGDMDFAIRRMDIRDNLLVLAADNIFAFSFDDLFTSFENRPDIHVGVWYNPDLADQARRGVVEMDATGRLISFSEKPDAPASHLAAAPLYLLPARLIYTVREFVESGGNVDAPGFLMEYLSGRHAVYGWRVPGDILDVGNPDSLAKAKQVLGEV